MARVMWRNPDGYRRPIYGSPYGPATLAGTDGLRQPVEAELTTARNLGSRLARVADRLKDLRVTAAP
jgi:NAD(P)H dehydrogenase (quinone)